MSNQDYKPIEHLHVAVRRSFDKAELCDAPQGVHETIWRSSFGNLVR